MSRAQRLPVGGAKVKPETVTTFKSNGIKCPEDSLGLGLSCSFIHWLHAASLISLIAWKVSTIVQKKKPRKNPENVKKTLGKP